MSDDYTPTTEDVRDTYVWGSHACGCCAEVREEDSEAFDRWFEGEKRRWQAEALRDGADQFEATAHAWGKIAMIDHLRARAERIENEGKQ